MKFTYYYFAFYLLLSLPLHTRAMVRNFASKACAFTLQWSKKQCKANQLLFLHYDKIYLEERLLTALHEGPTSAGNCQYWGNQIDQLRLDMQMTEHKISQLERKSCPMCKKNN